MDEQSPFVVTGEATAILPLPNDRRPVTVIGTEEIRATFDEGCLRQALQSAMAPGVDRLVLNPDAHVGYGTPVGSVLASGTHIYPGPIGVDIKCSMSLLQIDLDEEAIRPKEVRRALIEAICDRTPTGVGRGRRPAPKRRRDLNAIGRRAVLEGASVPVCEALGIPTEWIEYCEDARHLGHDRTASALEERFETLWQELKFRQRFDGRAHQLGSYGGGNHFGECEIVRVGESTRAKDVAKAFGLKDGGVAFLSHCGSRGLGNALATAQFQKLYAHFSRWGIPVPSADRLLVHAPLGTPEADAYLNDMALGANFATVNHLLINALVLEAFQEVFPGIGGRLVYFISHNIAREEPIEGAMKWVHRKGATRAFPAHHPELAGTPFEAVGHPILLPGDPQSGSAIMVAEEGAVATCYSVNHGAGRRLGRRAAARSLDQQVVNASFHERDILFNGRDYPVDEAPDVYKDFDAVLRSVELAGLASEVARLEARFVIKDGDPPDD